MGLTDILIYASFGIFLFILFVINFLRDAQVNRKFKIYDKILDGLIKENYNLKKLINDMPVQTEIRHSGGLDLSMDELAKRIDIRINDALSSRVIPMLQSLKKIEDSIDRFQDEQQDRIFNIEERTKNISKITPPNFDQEENRIVNMYRSGQSPEQIAKELNMGVGRVNLVLKLHKAI